MSILTFVGPGFNNCLIFRAFGLPGLSGAIGLLLVPVATAS